MITSRRVSLEKIKPNRTTHPGLWFDRYLASQLNRGESPAADQTPPKKALIHQVASLQPDQSENYQRFFSIWKESLSAAGVVFEKGHTIGGNPLGRLIINLGSESVLETSIAIHHTYGVPYLPGTALKGLTCFYARNYLEEKWNSDQEAYRILFGDQDRAGAVTFFDALYIPGSGFKGQPFWPDVISPQHPGYYQGQDVPPADWDSPDIIPFLSATGSFLIPLQGTEEWVQAALQILEMALRELGIGAKTSSGYGRLIFGEIESVEPEKIETFAEKKNRLLNEKDLPGDRVRSEVNNVISGGKYGFSDSPVGGPQVFIHPGNFQESSQNLIEGQVLEYRIVDTPKGPQARDIVVLLDPQ